MKRLIIITNDYPSKDKIYANAFIHSRTKYYIDKYKVFILVNDKIDSSYVLDGVNVIRFSNKNLLLSKLNELNPDIIGIHFVRGWMYRPIIKKYNIPIFIWVHGFEALSWHRRIGMIKQLYKIPPYIILNTFQLHMLHKIISYANKKNNIKFIFVSEWMKKITETDAYIKVKNYSIIPNPIDIHQFKFIKKDPKLRKKILMIRPFGSRKYATDIATEAILQLSKLPLFSDLTFDIYGDGAHFDSDTKKIKMFSNVNLHKTFVPHDLIDKLHLNNGIFLCPTRQDAQGVSMCEAMASGLVVITSNNTAIPEFVKHNTTGLLTNSVDDIVNSIIFLYNHPDKFLVISEQGSADIIKLSGHNSVINKELDLFERS